MKKCQLLLLQMAFGLKRSQMNCKTWPNPKLLIARVHHKSDLNVNPAEVLQTPSFGSMGPIKTAALGDITNTRGKCAREVKAQYKISDIESVTWSRDKS
jgi:hypothetical protein